MKNGMEIILKMLEQHFGKRGSKIIVCLILMVFEIKNIDIHEKLGISHGTLRRYRAALDAKKQPHCLSITGIAEKANWRNIVQKYWKTLTKFLQKISVMPRNELKNLQG